MFLNHLPSSTKKVDLSKIDTKIIEIASHSSKFDKDVSASKSNKAFEDSLRKNDSLSKRMPSSKSPLPRKIIFEKVEEDKSKI